VRLRCDLTVAVSEAQAQHVQSESYKGTIDGLKGAGELNVTAVRGLESWNPNGQFYLVALRGGAPLANVLLPRQGNNVAVILLRGPLLFEDADSIRAFLDPKIKALMSFKPVF